MLSRHGGVLELHKSKLNSSVDLKKAIETVLYDPKYTENARKLGKVLEDQPYQPKDVVLRHCNFAVQYGTLETLASEGRNLNVFQFYSLDIAFAAVFLLLIVTVVLFFIVRKLLRVVGNVLSHIIFSDKSCSDQMGKSKNE